MEDTQDIFGALRRQCNRCYHSWIIRSLQEPKRRPECGSPYWNKPRKLRRKSWLRAKVRQEAGSIRESAQDATTAAGRRLGLPANVSATNVAKQPIVGHPLLMKAMEW